MDHDRSRDAAFRIPILKFKTLRHVEIKLNRTALPLAADGVLDMKVDFRSIEGATALINRPEYPTIPLAIYTFLGRPGALNYGRALALSTLLMIITGGSILAIERLRLKNLTDF